MSGSRWIRNLGLGARGRVRAAIVVCGLGLALTAGAPAPSMATAVPATHEHYTFLVATPLSSPHPVLGADDRIHVVYELFVFNPTRSLMKLQELQILDARRHDAVIGTERGSRIVAHLSKEELDGRGGPGNACTNTLTLGSHQFGCLFLDATFPRGARIPRRLEHRFTFALTPAPEGRPSIETAVTGSVRVTHDSPVVIGPPLRGSRWLVGEGCCSPPSHHVAYVGTVNGAFSNPQRFAIDFAQLDPDDKLYSGPRSDLRSYHFFGAPVLSVAAGVVVGLRDRFPEESPPHGVSPVTAQNFLGNHLVIDIGGGHFAVYAHLQPGSLQVHIGEHIRQGQVIGRLGNTGNSDLPHLHFEIINGPGVATSDGLPFVFRSFSSEGTMTSSIADVAAGQRAVIGLLSRGHHRRQLPLRQEVIDFSGSAR
jgi:hypothetical protein